MLTSKATDLRTSSFVHVEISFGGKSDNIFTCVSRGAFCIFESHDGIKYAARDGNG